MSESSKGEASKDEAPKKPPGKLQQLLSEYGAIALIVFLSISVLTYTGLVIAISAGWEPEGAGEEAGVWLLAYGLLQATKFIRIPLVIVLTPIVARFWRRVRGKTEEAEASETESGSASDEAESDEAVSGDDEGRGSEEP